MTEKQDDVIVFIDNGYLKKVSARFKSQNVFNCDIKKFAINLSKEQKLFCKKIYFYDAPPFEDNKTKSKRYVEYTRNLKTRGIIVKEGRCQKILIDKARQIYTYKQKGVDAHITMDLLTCAFEKKANNFILITADTDFVPVIEKVKESKIKVILYCLKNKNRNFFLSNHLLDACNFVGLIKKEHFL
jgi:uncharacterized LabA/DUF88 family protein